MRFLLASSLLMLAACAPQPVQPWEKGILARPAMRPGGKGLEARYAEHIYTSKEGAQGGAGVGGGGCGCN